MVTSRVYNHWHYPGRWIFLCVFLFLLLVLIIVALVLALVPPLLRDHGPKTSREIESFNVIASCISARRRSRVGLRPHYGTGWLRGKSTTEEPFDNRRGG
jgi:hypothetical protein